jgi:hypothetical protein
MSRVMFLLVLAAAAFTGCASHGVAEQAALPPVRFEQTPCFGPCAVFVLSVDANGAAVWEVRKAFLEGPLSAFGPGTYRAQIPAEAHKAVVDAAETVDFARLLPRYDDPRVMDLPSTRYAVGTASVEQRYGGPDLSVLKSAFLQVLETAVWQHHSNPSHQN